MEGELLGQVIPNNLTFDYIVRFEKLGEGYRVIHYNQPWENDRKIEDDLKVMFEGEDLEGVKLPNYKTIPWEDLDQGRYDTLVRMYLYKAKSGSYEQLFQLRKLDPVEES